MKRIQHHQPSRNTLADIDTAVRKRAGQGLVEARNVYNLDLDFVS